MATADIPFDADLVVEGDWSASSGYEATRQVLALTDRPTAIFCQNDRTAIGCYEALKEAGLQIPPDMAVVGYDDDEISRHLLPPLTTSILPHRAMGQWAIEQLEVPAPPGRGRYPLIKLECPLVERELVSAAAGSPAHSRGLRPAEAPHQPAELQNGLNAFRIRVTEMEDCR